MRLYIPAAVIEFDEEGNTLWVQSPMGATILRIKTMGKINVHRGCINSVSHADVMVQEDIEICITKEDEAKGNELMFGAEA